MRRLLVALSTAFLISVQAAAAQPLTVDPESIVPLPDKFDIEVTAPDVPREIARFQGAWIGTWHDDRHILVVERVKPDGHANVVFAQSDSAFYNHESRMVARRSNDH
jgi:membrane carboxypeptidase/penicillin-binding protein